MPEIVASEIFLLYISAERSAEMDIVTLDRPA